MTIKIIIEEDCINTNSEEPVEVMFWNDKIIYDAESDPTYVKRKYNEFYEIIVKESV